MTPRSTVSTSCCRPRRFDDMKVLRCAFATAVPEISVLSSSFEALIQSEDEHDNITR